MARGGVAELAGVRVEREEGRRRHAGVGDDLRQPARDLGGRGVLVGERAEGVAELPHQHRGRDAAAGDVADGDVDDAVGAAHGVVPVPADLEPDRARVVAAREPEPFDHRQLVRQEAPLQRRGDIVLPLRVAGPPERPCCVVGVGGKEGVIGVVEHFVVREQERHRPDRAPGGGVHRERVDRAGGRHERLVERREDGSDGLGLGDAERRARQIAEPGDLDEPGRAPVDGAGVATAERPRREAARLVVLEPDDDVRARERRRERVAERSRHFRGCRGLSQGLPQLVPTANLLLLGGDLAA